MSIFEACGPNQCSHIHRTKFSSSSPSTNNSTGAVISSFPGLTDFITGLHHRIQRLIVDHHRTHVVALTLQADELKVTQVVSICKGLVGSANAVPAMGCHHG